MKTRTFYLALATASGIALLAIGAAGGWWWARHTAPVDANALTAQTPPSAPSRKILYWYDPMQAQQHFDKPGKSPFMDMDLVPMYAEETNTDPSVKIDANLSQSLGMRLTPVERVPMATRIEATAVLGFNERDVAVIQTRSTGFVQRVWPLAPGDLVKSGQPLVEFVFPEWTAAQREWVALQSSNDAQLLAAARDKMHLLGMTDEFIEDVEKNKTPRIHFILKSPISGVLQVLEVRAGMTVNAGQTVARVNGLSSVWLEASVPEAQAAAIRPGARAEASIAGFPGEIVHGRVNTILPALNEAARSLRVRVELPNTGGRLKPGFSAQVSFVNGETRDALAIPTEALIRTGKRALVMLAGDEGQYKPVEVTLGQEIGDRTVILNGLSEGQRVVASGQFLIDSEARLKGIEARFAPPGSRP